MPELTGPDRDVIKRARELAAVTGADAVRDRAGETDTGETDAGMAYAVVFGEARYLLAELAAIAERLGGS